jgi:hypothetical protein
MELVGAYTPPCRERRRIPAGGYGVRIYYGLTGETSEAFPFRLAGPLKTAKVLPYSVFTKRKKGRFDFRPAIASRAGLPHGDGLSGGGRVF